MVFTVCKRQSHLASKKITLTCEKGDSKSAEKSSKRFFLPFCLKEKEKKISQNTWRVLVFVSLCLFRECCICSAFNPVPRILYRENSSNIYFPLLFPFRLLEVPGFSFWFALFSKWLNFSEETNNLSTLTCKFWNQEALQGLVFRKLLTETNINLMHVKISAIWMWMSTSRSGINWFQLCMPCK